MLHTSSYAAYAALPVATYVVLRFAWRRYLTLRAASPLPTLARLVSGVVGAYRMGEDEFFGADGALAGSASDSNRRWAGAITTNRLISETKMALIKCFGVTEIVFN